MGIFGVTEKKCILQTTDNSTTGEFTKSIDRGPLYPSQNLQNSTALVPCQWGAPADSIGHKLVEKQNDGTNTYVTKVSCY